MSSKVPFSKSCPERAKISFYVFLGHLLSIYKGPARSSKISVCSMASSLSYDSSATSAAVALLVPSSPFWPVSFLRLIQAGHFGG